jgi:hypothetical protein
VEDLLSALDQEVPDRTLVQAVEAMLKIESPTALARATGLMLWKRAWVAEHGEQRGGDRRSPGAENSKPKTFRFCSAAAEKLNLSERAIELDVALAEALGVADIRRLWSSKISDNAAALRTVATLKPEQRASLYSAMKADASFATALATAGLKPERDSADWMFNRLFDLWEEAPIKVRRRFLQQIGGTAGVLRVLRDRSAAA